MTVKRKRILVAGIGIDASTSDPARPAWTRSAWLLEAYELQRIELRTGANRRQLAATVARTVRNVRPAVVHLCCNADTPLDAYATCLVAIRRLELPSVVEVIDAEALASIDDHSARAQKAIRRAFADADVRVVHDDASATTFQRHLDCTADIVACDGSPDDRSLSGWELDWDDCYQRALVRSGSPRTRARRFFFRRLRQMRPDEIMHRIGYALRRRRAANRTAARQTELARGMRTAEARQVAGLMGPEDFDAIGVRLRTDCPAAHRSAIEEVGRLRDGARVVFGRLETLPLPIAYERDPTTGFVWPRVPESEFTCPTDVDVKGVWELGKLSELARLAWLGRVLGHPEDIRFASAEAERFLREHPPGTSPHWVSPLEVSIRLVSLLWVITCGDRHAAGESSRASLIDGAAAHLDFLYDERSVFRDPNNHVIGEAVGLLLGGLVLPGVPGAASYVQEGLRILARELPRQLDETGCSREGSTDYHRQVAEWVMQAALGIHRLAPNLENVPDDHRERALACMSAWTGSTGTMPRFGDTDHARVFALGPIPSTDGRIFEVYRTHSGPEPPAQLGHDPLVGLTLQAMRGTLAMGTRSAHVPTMPPPNYAGGIHRASDPAGLDLYFKTGGVGLLPQRGHAHADLLAVQLHTNGVPRIAEAGTHQYGTSASRRYLFRGARHHATLYLPPDQADQLDLFKWATDPIPGPCHRVGVAGIDVICGSHDGYARARIGAVHRREVVRIDGGLVIVIDRVGGRGSTLAVFPYPLGPNVKSLTSSALGSSGARVTYDDGAVLNVVVDHPGLRRVWRRGGPFARQSSRYSELHPGHALELAGRTELPLHTVTLLHLAGQGVPEPRGMRVDHTGSSVHIDIGFDDPMGRRVEYTQRHDGTRDLLVSEHGRPVAQHTLKLPAEWDAE